MDPSKLSRSLGGSRRFTVAELARIADAGSVDAAWLLGSGSGTGRVSGVMAAANARTSAAPSAASPTAPAGGRPLQIVRETVRLIAERGFHAVRVSDIADACATSTAAIHYHFPGRAELLEAAVRWCMDEDTARRAARIAEADDAADELRQLIELQTPRTTQQRRQWLVWLDLWAEAARSTAIGRLHTDYYRQWRTTVADVDPARHRAGRLPRPPTRSSALCNSPRSSTDWPHRYSPRHPPAVVPPQTPQAPTAATASTPTTCAPRCSPMWRPNSPHPSGDRAMRHPIDRPDRPSRSTAPTRVPYESGGAHADEPRRHHHLRPHRRR